jgi:hypothetical protein
MFPPLNDCDFALPAIDTALLLQKIVDEGYVWLIDPQ